LPHGTKGVNVNATPAAPNSLRKSRLVRASLAEFCSDIQSSVLEKLHINLV
jgi:hypothetical protein